MKRILLLLLITISSINGLHAKDFTFIDQLPLKLAQAMKQSQPGWDSGVTTKMNQATYEYNNALIALIKDLASRYYPKEFFTGDEISDYLKSLYNVRRFKQNVINPSGESRGTEAILEVPSEVSTDLEATISDMVEAIAATDPKFNFRAWKKHWERTQRQ